MYLLHSYKRSRVCAYGKGSTLSCFLRHLEMERERREHQSHMSLQQKCSQSTGANAGLVGLGLSYVLNSTSFLVSHWACLAVSFILCQEHLGGAFRLNRTLSALKAYSHAIRRDYVTKYKFRFSVETNIFEYFQVKVELTITMLISAVRRDTTWYR